MLVVVVNGKRDVLDIDIMVEWECGTTFLLRLPDITMAYGWCKYGRTKLHNKRPMYITVPSKPNYILTENAAAWDDFVYKSLQYTCHPKGTVTVNDQFMAHSRTKALLGIIPQGTREQLTDHLLSLELEEQGHANYRA